MGFIEADLKIEHESGEIRLMGDPEGRLMMLIPNKAPARALMSRMGIRSQLGYFYQMHQLLRHANLEVRVLWKHRLMLSLGKDRRFPEAKAVTLLRWLFAR